MTDQVTAPPSVLLREAARIMRERAQAATPGPWEAGDRYGVAGILKDGRCAYCGHGEPIWIGRRDINGTVMPAHVHTLQRRWPHGIVAYRDGVVTSVVNDTDEYGYMSDGNAEHIASWHPAVALAVADWLDETARELDEVTKFHGADDEPGPHFGAALSVARVYLGRTDE